MTEVMSISRNGLLFIARREALVLVAYQDGPHMSIGFGHNDPSLKAGDSISVKDAFEQLREDLKAREKNLNKYLKVPVVQREFDALMSLHYQSGNRFMVHTKKYPGPFIVDAINSGRRWDTIAFWQDCDTNLKGEHLPGLRKRRLLEIKVFVDGDYGDLDPIPFWKGNPNKTKPELYHLQPGDVP